jgi:AcrR family transcriptional regulator
MTNRREAILDVFSKLVSCYGLGKTAMQDVAQEMGISVGTIYNDFTNKEDLILAFWQRVEEQCIVRLDSVAKQDLVPEELLRLIMLFPKYNFEVKANNY